MLSQNTNGTLWFDGYRGQKTLILDDFYGWLKYGDLLKILEGHPYRCQMKGRLRGRTGRLLSSLLTNLQKSGIRQGLHQLSGEESPISNTL